jgi:pimeloyl-ACP methyl ester carboxylesterase
LTRFLCCEFLFFSAGLPPIRACKADFEMNRQRFFETATVTTGAFSLGLGAHPERLPAMTTIAQTGSETTAIRPFPKLNVPEAELVDLRARINATRWPKRELVPDQTQGVQLATAQALAHYWANGYDWRNIEARLNATPQFVTEIDGVDIQFIHVRSKHDNALPLIITHGWPGSIIEQMKVIDLLGNPTAHGASAADAFHLVIPSIPGYGYSAEPAALGWDPVRIAKAWIVLMQRLGYPKFVAQGGDWGAAITQQLGLLAGPVLAIHSNMPGTVPSDTLALAIAGGNPPAGLSADELHAFEQLKDFYGKHLGYAVEMSNRPQTLYALQDSPIGLAAWILDHDRDSYELIARAFAGNPGGLSRDDVLDNITMYWLTKTGISSARLYWENKLGFFNVQGVKIPTGVSAFPYELYTAPESWSRQAYPALVFYKKHDVGGHFAAWEQPQLFSEDVRATFRPIRGQA